MKHMRNILEGMAIMGDVLSQSAPYPDCRGGFIRDREALRQDGKAVTQRFNRQIHRAYGKQEYATQS